MAANASVAVRVTITKAAARRLRRRRRLAVVLALTGAREDADGTTLTRTLTLRRHRTEKIARRSADRRGSAHAPPRDVPRHGPARRPSTASAVTTSVTGVTAGGISRFIVDVSNPPMVHFTGTADVASVDLKCVSSQAGGGFSALTIADNVTVTSNAFATDAAWPSEGLCEVFAVNHGASVTSNTDLNGLSGMKVYPAYFDFSQTSGKTYDYYVQAEGSGAEVGFDSFGDCTMDYAQLVQLHEYDGQPFDCNGYVERIDQAAGGDTPSIRVDTHPAVPAYYIGSEGLGAVPGWTDVTFGVFDDAGSWRVEGHEGIYRCAGDDTFPPSSCAAFTSTGVRLDVTETLSPDARTIVQKLRFVSEDNQQHTLSTTLNQTSPLPREWFFPGTAGFQDYPLEANPSVTAPAVATIRNRDSGSADPDITKGFGAITYGSTPSEEEFWNAGRYFVQRYSNMTIPAGKAVRIEFIYNLAAGSSGLDSQVAAAESSIGRAARDLRHLPGDSDRRRLLADRHRQRARDAQQRHRQRRFRPGRERRKLLGTRDACRRRQRVHGQGNRRAQPDHDKAVQRDVVHDHHPAADQQQPACRRRVRQEGQGQAQGPDAHDRADGLMPRRGPRLLDHRGGDERAQEGRLGQGHRQGERDGRAEDQAQQGGRETPQAQAQALAEAVRQAHRGVDDQRNADGDAEGEEEALVGLHRHLGSASRLRERHSGDSPPQWRVPLRLQTGGSAGPPTSARSWDVKRPS